MTDEEFLKLKNQIKELGDMCRKFNIDCSELINNLPDLDKSFVNLERDVHTLNTDVDKLQGDLI